MFESITTNYFEQQLIKLEGLEQLKDVGFDDLSQFQKNFARQALEGACREAFRLAIDDRGWSIENHQLKLAALAYAYPEVDVYHKMYHILSAVHSELESIEELSGHSKELKDVVLQVQKLMGDQPPENSFVQMFRKTDCISEFPSIPSCSELRQAIYVFTEIILEKPTIESNALLLDDDSGLNLAVEDLEFSLVELD